MRPGRIVFAATMLFLGVIGTLGSDVPTWAGVPDWMPRGVVFGLCAAVALTAGAGLLAGRTAFSAARLLLAWCFVWLVCFRMSYLLTGWNQSGVWWGVGDTAAMAGAAWALCVQLAGASPTALGLPVGARGLRIARGLYGLALMPFGVAHFTYLARTVSLVPSYLPFHLAIACATGAAFIAAGLGIVFEVWPALAAILVLAQMTGFTLLVWVPILVRGNPSPSDWAEFVGSVALVGAGSVIADSYAAARKRETLPASP